MMNFNLDEVKAFKAMAESMDKIAEDTTVKVDALVALAERTKIPNFIESAKVLEEEHKNVMVSISRELRDICLEAHDKYSKISEAFQG